MGDLDTRLLEEIVEGVRDLLKKEQSTRLRDIYLVGDIEKDTARSVIEKLREMVLNDPMDALTESLLIFAARRDHLRNVIEPALARGDVVLCDRFTDATFAYQGAGRGFDLGVLSTLERLTQTGLAPEANLMREPDLTVWFDLAPEVAAERLAGARVPDRFEAQPVEFFRRVAQGYADRAAAAPQRFARLDAAQERHRVWQQLTSVFVRKGWLAIMVATQGGPQ